MKLVKMLKEIYEYIKNTPNIHLNDAFKIFNIIINNLGIQEFYAYHSLIYKIHKIENKQVSIDKFIDEYKISGLELKLKELEQLINKE